MLQVWDSLVALLIVFPMLIGGIWIERPGIQVEIADLGAGAAVLAALTLLGKAVFKLEYEKSLTSRILTRLAKNWQDALANRVRPTLAWSTAAIAVIWSLAALRRHWALETHAFDVGIFTNTIWNLVHGYGYDSSVKGGISLFADHQSPIFWTLAPLFRLFPHPETLLIAQAVGLAAGAIPLIFIARQLVGKESWISAAVPLLYWAWLPVRNAVLFDFHPEVFMLPLFLGAIAGLQSERNLSRVLGVFCLLAGLLCKESAGPVAAGIGLAWLLGAGPETTRAFTKRLGIAVIALGIGAFLFDLKIVPKLVGGEKGLYAYDELYSQYGGGLIGLITAPFLKPVLVLKQLLGPSRLKFLFWTLAPLGFAPLFSSRALVAALPGYLMLFLSAGDVRVNVAWHYGIEPGVGLFLALPGGLAFYDRWARASRNRQAATGIGIVFLALVTFGRSEIYKIRHFARDAHAEWVAQDLLPRLDPSVPMAATEALVPQLSTRHWITRADFLWKPTRESADCVVYDSALSNWPMDSADEARLFQLMSQAPWKEIYGCGSVHVWSRGPACLNSLPDSCKPKS